MQTSKVLETLCNLVIDCANMCLIEGSRDILEIRRRVQHEGLSFITITLPSFGKDFERSLEQGCISTDLFTGWRKRRGLPEFLRGFLCLCFDPQNERIVNDESTYIIIQAVRQICYFTKKISVACCRERVKRAFGQYKRTDNDLAKVSASTIGNILLDRYRYISRSIVGRLFHDRVFGANLNLHHGPGSTAERVIGNAKYVPSYTWPERLSKIGLGPELAYSSEECYHHSPISTPMIDESQELPVRVVSVPKTLKTPRIIAMEPVAMQMAQQGVKDFIVERIESHFWTKGHINFKDQSINRTLALDNSKTLRLATLDLEEASDRVPAWLVAELFEANRDLQELVMSCRSRAAKLPDGEVIQLNKYASMGSALCFPVEALHFFVMLIVAGLEFKALECTPENIYKISREYYVYGDDIICPVDQVKAVIDTFNVFGSVVSKTKSFYRGSFRESCGMDAYMGFDVTPVYMRNTIPNSRCEAPKIISIIETANQLALKGYARSSNYLRMEVESLIGSLPVVDDHFGGLGWKFGEDTLKRERFNKRYQRKEVLTYAISVNFKPDVIDGYPALTKCLYRLEKKPNTQGHPWEKSHEKIKRLASQDDDKHLVRAPRTIGTLTLKRRWIPC